ncbi:non-ribosomal peptide synthase/polyketide synthase [Pseudomonas sp. KNUC1026]|uniref:non-ribosomal peptide synthase/polyketide synthase n=1 Tax=Pseudomonas sp. KNUC1026 TaxID=2893890 RepID=UPI001F3A5FCD|nr:non-ribosomal peptide synthase/polyketide synthase [Pseudomonas sp. KNUC1026]UFH49859.1 non-ribosomal peptide synthase/polyketide synthase [Pseudomonas sp. KNUC1026]
MRNSDQLALVQRFIRLPLAQRRAFLEKLQSKGMSLAQLPIPRVEGHEGDLPLSYAQQRLWFLWKFEPESSAYNIPSALRLKGALDTAALQFAFERLIERHASLRTRFIERQGQPCQWVEPSAELPLRRVSVPEGEAVDAWVKGFIEREIHAPFDLEQGPLLRVCLVATGADEHVLVMTVHHIVADGWSMPVLVKDLTRFYQASLAGQDAALPALCIDYSDYALWQRSWMEAGECQRQLAYWTQQLGTEHPVLELPTDRPRKAIQGAEGATLEFTLGEAFSQRIKQCALAAGVTPYVLLLAAFQAWLHRYSGRPDIRVGVPVANRNRVETEALIGFFVNTQIMRAQFSAGLSFAQLLEQVKHAAVEAQTYQDLPFDQLVEALHPERSLSHNPLFQVMFNYQRDSGAGASAQVIGGLQIEGMQWDSHSAQFDLSLDVIDSDKGFSLAWNYASDLFDAPTAQRMARHWQNLLEAIIEAPGERVDTLGLLDDQEQRAALTAWNRNGLEYPSAQPVHALFEAQVRVQPEATALIFEDRALSYAELNTQANRLAHQLIAQGVGPEVLVGIAVERSLEMVVGILAVLKAGGGYVPLDPQYPQDRLYCMIEDSRIALLLTQSGLQAQLPIPSGLPVLLLDAPLAADLPVSNPDVPVAPQNLAYVMFTSGSTGRPKGVGINHLSLTRHAYVSLDFFNLGGSDRVLQFSTFNFDGFVEQLYPALVCGASVVIRGPDIWDSETFYRHLIDDRITTVDLTTAYWYLITKDFAQHGPRDYGLLRQVHAGGEAMPPEGIAVWKQAGLEHVTLLNTYGPTEATVTVTALDCSDYVNGNKPIPAMMPIGDVLGGRSIYLLDQALQPTPQGVAGEILIGGELLARGYFGRAALTAERFVPDPFEGSGQRLYRTGDLARANASGTIEYVGRIDHQVKIRGFRIELGEIEAKLLADSRVGEAIVLARESANGLQLVAYVVPNAPCDEAELRDTLRADLKASLPDYMVPAHWLVLERLPLSPNGKLDRKALPAPDLAAQQDAYIAPVTALEQAVAGIWQTLLNVEQVGLSDHFFELGGHSLLATQVISRIRRGLNLEASLRTLFEHPQLGAFVAALAPAQGRDVPAFTLADRSQPLPLSFAQQRQWILWQLEPQSAAYNIPAAMTLKGALDTAALEQAFNALIQRHETLRTTFAQHDGEALQVIHASLPLVLAVEEGPSSAAGIKALVEAEVARPFDLETGPLLRVRLVRMGADEHVLTLTLHHIVSDGWSTPILVQELVRLYAGFAQGQPAELPALPIQYADYAQWQRTWMEKGERDRQLAYWTAQLGGEQPVLELPLDRPRPAVQSLRGASIEIEIPAGLSEGIKALAKREGATPFMVLLAAYQALLHRYSGQPDIRVGVPIANRNHLETEGLIGFFVNTQVLKATFDAPASFSALLQQARQASLAAQRYQDLPFDQLVEALQPERNMSHNPLFQVMFNYLRDEGPQDVFSTLDGIGIEALAWDSHTTQIDLAMSVDERRETFGVSLAYATDLFDEQTVQQLARHWMNLLAAAVAHPAQLIHELPMLAADEAERTLRGWNGTQHTWADEQPVHVLFERQVLAQPQHTALLFGDASLTYAQVNQRANQLAHQLIELGVGPEVIVGISAERSLEMIIGLMAILKAGGAYVPLDPEYPQDRLSYMFEDSGIDLLLTQEHLLPGLPAFAGRTLLLESDFSHFSSENPAVHVEPENLAYVIYTSGSTGKPKGAGNRHTALHNRLAWMQSAYPLDASDTVLQKTPFSFDVSVWEFFWPLMTGARLAIAAPGEHREPEKLIETIQRHSVTTLHFVPSMLQVFIHEPGVEQCVSLKQIMCSGEALQVDAQQQVFARLPSAGLYNLYGPTEAAIDVTHWTCRDEGVDTVPIGEPIANLYTHILDASLNPVPQGATGELVLGGLGLARGYHRRPALTAERFIPDPHAEVPGSRLYRTGDLAKYRETGVIEYQGRIDHQVKIRGLRIELGEIEARLLEQESVKEAVVLAVEGVGGLQLVAYIVPVAFDDDASSQAALRDTLKTELKAHLPDYMVPAQMLCLAKLPVTPNGKLDRRALPAPEAASSQAVYIAPVTELEQAVAKIWQGVLKAEQVGLNDHFFELGGHSLLATQVVSRIRRSLGIEAALRTLFEHPQLGGFVAALDPTQARDVPAFTLADRSRPLPVSFAQQRQWVLWQLDPHSAAYNIPAAMTLKGPLNVEALQQSFNALIQRHESLRTTFTQQEGEALQVIHSSLPLAIHAEEGQYDEAGINAFVEAEVARPFDLENGPLLRVRLLKVGAEEHVLTLTLHHIVSDAWSTPILVQELVRLYAGFAQGQPAELPALPIQYADYALWQRTWMANGERDRQLAYWTAQLGGEQPVLELPLDRPRPAAQSFRGASVDLQITTALSAGIRALAKREGATPFMVLLAAYQTLLHRYSGQADIRVGVPIANRNHLETEGLIGFFVNTQVLKADFDANTNFSALLKQVKHASLDAQRYQDLPFDQLVEALQPERNMSHNPLFQAMFNYLRAEDQQGLVDSLGGLSIRGLGRDTHTAQLDLTLDVGESPEGFSASLIYATDLFDATTAQRLASHWLQLLEAVVAEPQRRLSAQSMLAVEETRATFAAWNPQPASFEITQCIHQRITEQAMLNPEAIAATLDGEHLSYGDLNAQANQLAHHLIEAGVRPEARVGLATGRSLEMVVGLLAILKAGGAYVPLDPEYPQDRLAYMMQDSGIALLLVQEAVQGKLPAFDGQSLLLGADRSAYGAENPNVAVDPANLAYIIYTSGSTGMPKGTLLPHQNVMRLFEATEQWFGFTENDVWTLFHSYAFDFSVWEIFGALMFGGRLVIVPYLVSRSPEDFHQLLCDEGVTVLNQTPSAFRQLMHVATQDKQRDTSLRYVVFGGEALEVENLRPWFERFGDQQPQLINMYGITETTVHVTYRPITLADLTQGAASPIGEPIPDLSWYLLDADLNPVPRGCTGELYVGRAGLARGYLNRGDLSATRFIPDPFGEAGGRLYRTGDLARYRADGVIEYIGRIDHQVKIRGFRIELGEIEAKLLAQASVREAVVLAPEILGSQQLVAYIVPQQYEADALEQGEQREALKAALKADLPDYMVPAHLLFLEQLPLTANGKLDRKALPAPDASQLQGDYLAPRSDLEQRIAAIWQDVLRLERVGLADNFFELGGDSIISIQVVSRARQAGIRFTPKDLFQHQTVQALAAVAQVGEQGLLIDQGPVTGQALLLPIQQAFFAGDIPERHHWNQSVLLKTSAALQPALLEQALQALITHHDALRLTFSQHAEGWQAHFAGAGQQHKVLWHRTVESTDALEALCEQAQRSLNLEQGPLLRAVLADLPDGSQRLLLAIHHLAVDGVSWRVLLEDLPRAYQQLQQGQPLKLPAKTSSVQAWAQKLQGYAQSDTLQAELGYWKTLLAGAPADLPVDNAQGGLQASHAGQASTHLPRELTRKLLQQAPAAYRTQINDLLLTALAQVISRWTGQADVLLELEGHGREELFDDADLTRTVGWFTSVFPVRLATSASLGESIKQVKESLRAIPAKGIGFGALRYLGDAQAQQALAALPVPRITFNYLGQFDGSFASDDGQALFAPAPENSGAEQCEQAPLQNWLSINGQVYNGELSLGWSFSREMFDEATVQRLAADYAQQLQALVEHCCAAEAGGVTPSDFPLAQITQAQLDRLPAAREVDDLYPLSPMQQGMLFHTLLGQGSGDYVNQMRLDVAGLDVERFRAAWQGVVDAHDILRTAFLASADQPQPLQVVYRNVTVDFAVQQAECQALADAELRRGFDLEQPSLIRLRLVPTGPDSHHLIYTSHHILMDGWSNSQLLGEVLERYNGHTPAASAGRYRDYIAWLQRQDAQADQAFWAEALKGLNEPALLERAVASGPTGEHGYGKQAHSLNTGSTARLAEFARTRKVTVNTLVRAGWLLLLQRYTGQACVAFGATVSGRPTELAGIEQQIGLFINTLAVVGAPLPEQPLAAFLDELQAQNLALREHEHSPLFDVQRWAGRAGEALFDTLLVFENYPVAEALEQGAPAGLAFGQVQSSEQTNYPLTLIVNLGQQLVLEFSYAKASYHNALIEQLGAHLVQLLEAMVARPECAVGELPMLSGVEQQATFNDWNPQPEAFGVTRCIHQRITEQAMLNPEAIAATLDGEHLSYGDLNAQANQLAHHLIEAGVRPEARVGLATGRSLEMVVGLLAILKAGGAYVPLDPEYPQDRLAYMMQDSGIALLLVQEAVQGKLPAFDGQSLLLGADRSAYSTENPNVAVDPANLAYIIYTSGSTGMPKGTLLPHQNVMRLFDATEQWFGFTEKDVWTLFHSYAFDFSVWEIFGALMFGGRLVIVPYLVSRSPEDFHQLLCDEGVTVLNQTPSAFRQLMHVAVQDPRGTALRYVVFGGEALEVENLRPWFERFGDTTPQLINMYGITETTVHVTYRPLTLADLTQGAASPIGEPIPDLSWYLLDADLNPVPRGCTGELYVGRAGLARGYLNRGDLSATRFIPDPFGEAGGRLYRTGDLARYRADGVIEYIGRIDHQVKIRGFRIELGEIEARLLAQASVREAVVLAPEILGSQQLVAYIVPQQYEADALEQGEQREALKAALKADLPDYMVPAHLLFLEQLPLTANGKLDRKALPAPESALAQGAYLAPQTELECGLAAIWEEVLGAERVGLGDNFFELGGHSLLATQVVSKARQRLATAPALRDLFTWPVLGELAAHLAGHRAETLEYPALQAREHHGQASLSLAQRRLWIVEQLAGGSAAYGMPLALRLHGALQVDVLRASLAEVVQRHEVLRTAYPMDDEGDPIALIQASIDVQLPLLDLSGLPPAQQEHEVAEAALANASLPISLDSAPLWRARILRLAANEHVLLFSMHHILSDGWSMGVLVDELTRCYGRLIEGKQPNLAPLPIQYSDYADWQQALEDRGILKAQAGYWQQNLAGYSGQLALATDHPRPARASQDGASVSFSLPAELSARVLELSRQHGVTPYITLLTAFQCLLHRLAGSDDVVVGADIAGRHQPELEGLIGFFVNVLPLRSRFAEGARFADCLAAAKQNTLGAFEHQDLPLDMIVDASGVARHPGMNPLLQVLFVMDNLPPQAGGLAGIRVEQVPVAQEHSKFDMALFVTEQGGQLHGNWVYATDLFKQESIDRFVSAWTGILEQVSADQGMTLGEITMPASLAANPADAAPVGKKADKLGKFLKKAPGLAKPAVAPIRESLLVPEQAFPLLMEPQDASLDIIEWIKANRPLVEQKLGEHAGILFRGFALTGIHDFEAFAEAVQPGLYGQYGDLPKKEGGKNTYRSTPYPEQKMILFHNESSHQDRWPRKQMFYCELPSPVGGATPVVDCRLMFQRLPEGLRQVLEEKGLLYVRTFAGQLDVPWQHFFKTEDRAVVEARCSESGIDWEWLDNDELQIRTWCPAIITHPVTGDRSFFNQVQLHHTYWLEPEVGEDMLAMFGPERMPRHVYFGDGSPISDADMQLIGDLYEACAVRFDWQKGDVILLDNMLVAHARDPFEGPRKIVVAMGDMYERADLPEGQRPGQHAGGRTHKEGIDA